ncbi:MAG: VanW family protein [Clostridia bacterium]|nr:VanW family protein [Clostridia bacterium]
MKQKSNRVVVISVVLLSVVCIFAISVFAIYNKNGSGNKFYNNVIINGIDVGGMNISEASNVLETDFKANRDKLKISLKYMDKKWEYSYKDFEPIDDFSLEVGKVFNSISSNNMFERFLKKKQLNQNDGKIDISYRKLLGGFDKKLDIISDEIYTELIEPRVEFVPNEKNPFNYIEGQSEVVVDRQKLEELIDDAFKDNKNISITIPTVTTKPSITIDSLKSKTKLRSQFSTSYANSNGDRKSNIKTALSSFNGLVVFPEEEISFNQTTGARTKQNGYKPANIILNGVYVEGTGGGVCQASTTMYNAVLLANLEILEVNKHSMPAAYVPLGLDAMVSEGVSDLKFKNTTDEPIYIKTWCDKTCAYVQIYGLPFENGEYYKTRSEFVKSLPHSGDRVLQDTDGKYSNKVTFKGEYLRLKYPHEGYEANVYLEHYTKNGELIDESLIRHEVYLPQEGIIIEGTEDLYDGINLPKNDVKFISPQTTSQTNGNNVSGIINGKNAEKYNP